jgi:hypothetical protein
MRNALWFLAGGVVVGGAVAAAFLFMHPHHRGHEQARNGEPVTREQVVARSEAHIAKLDTDGDGAITRAEWEALRLARFDAADSNKDGVLSKEEMRAAHKAMKAAGEKGDPS